MPNFLLKTWARSRKLALGAALVYFTLLTLASVGHRCAGIPGHSSPGMALTAAEHCATAAPASTQELFSPSAHHASADHGCPICHLLGQSVPRPAPRSGSLLLGSTWTLAPPHRSEIPRTGLHLTLSSRGPPRG